MGRSKVILQLVSTASFRKPFLDEVTAVLGEDFEIVAGRGSYIVAVPIDLKTVATVHPVENHHLLGRRLLWQSGVVRRSLSAGTVVLTFNPRALSNWAVLLMRRVLRRRTILWGHVWSRSGERSRTNRLRRIAMRLSNGFLAYTDEEARTARNLLGVGRVWVAPNALIREAEAPLAPPGANPANFIISSRLVEDKKPHLAFDAFARALQRLPADSRLLVVGSGPLEEALRDHATELGLGSRVEFLGAVYDHERLADLYSTAVCSLSPGYVGLSIIQSHLFGVPMIYASGEPHAPEVTLADDGFNAFPFPADDADALAERLVESIAQRDQILERRTEIASLTRSEHSAEAMARGFVDAVRGTAETAIS